MSAARSTQAVHTAAPKVQLELLTDARDSARLAQLLRIERAAHPHPWTEGNFSDSVRAGHRVQMVCTEDLGACRTWGVDSENRPQQGQFAPTLPPHSGPMGQKGGEKWAAAVDLQPTIRKSDRLLGYSVTMRGVDEAHLLNLTVAPAFERQGWARVLLDALALWARQERLQWLWLEVRVSNLRAQQVYARYGFRSVSVRRAYYPATGGVREDALVMSYKL